MYFSPLPLLKFKKKKSEGIVTTTNSCKTRALGVGKYAGTTREDVQGKITVIVKDFAHLSLQFIPVH